MDADRLIAGMNDRMRPGSTSADVAVGVRTFGRVITMPAGTAEDINIPG